MIIFFQITNIIPVHIKNYFFKLIFMKIAKVHSMSSFRVEISLLQNLLKIKNNRIRTE